MRRREVLGGAAGLLASIAVVGRVRGAEPFEPIAQLEIDGAKEVVVDADGSAAYLATTDGFAAVDVSDPTAPTALAERRDLLSDREDGPFEMIWDVAIDGDRLLIAGPANPANGPNGFLLYDVSDPADPERLAFHETAFPIHNATLVDDVAYLTAGGSIVAVGVSGDEPRRVGRWSIVDADDGWAEVNASLRPPHDLWVQDGLAYVACWDAGTWIVDVADPASPAAVGRVGGIPREDLADRSGDEIAREATEPPGNHHYAQPSSDGSLLAVGKESWRSDEGDGGPSGIDLWDVSDPAAPEWLSTIPPLRAEDETRGGTWTTAHNFDLAGDRLYSSWYQGGVKVHDVSDPAAPEEIAHWRRPGEAAFWAAVLATDEFFVASSTAYPDPSITEGLYAFPNRPGEQSDPPTLTEPHTETTSPTRRSNSTATRTGAADTRTTVTTATDEAAPTPSPGQPGFGGLTALGGALAAGWWRSRAGVDESVDDRN